MDFIKTLYRNEDANNTKLLKELEKQEELLGESTDSSSDDDEYSYSEHDSDATREDNTYNIDKANTKTVFNVESHIDPTTLTCKDTLRHIHVRMVSKNLPLFSDSSAFGYAPSKENSNSAWKKLDGKDSLKYNKLSVMYTLDINHPMFGLRGTAQKRTYGVLAPEAASNHKELTNYAIKGLPVKSPLYVYSLKISRKKNPTKFDFLKGYNLWECDKCSLLKKPINRANIAFLVLECIGLTGPDVARFEKELFAMYPGETEISDFKWKDYEKIMKTMGIGNRIHDRETPELIRYIYCQEVEVLTRYYNEKIVLNMRPRVLMSLYDTILNNPFQLFILKALPYKFRICKKLNRRGNNFDDKKKERKDHPDNNNAEPVDAMSESDEMVLDEEEDVDIDTSEKLEQLTYNKDIVAVSYHNFTLGVEVFWLFLPELDDSHIDLLSRLSPDHRDIVKVYNVAKTQQAEGNHACFDRWELTKAIEYDSTNPIPQSQRFENAVHWLTTTPLRTAVSSVSDPYTGYVSTAMKYTGERYYLRMSHLNTTSIVESMSILADRWIKHNTMTMDEKETVKQLRETLGAEADTFLYNGIENYVGEVDFDEGRIPPAELNKFDSDQWKGLELFKKTFVLMILGRGGVGKTHWTHTMLKGLKPEEYLITAKQGRNTSGYQERAYTMDMLACMHKKACATESWSTRNVFRRPAVNGLTKDINSEKECNGIKYHRCPFEKVKVLFIDEMSLVNDEILAVIIAQVVNCGQLSKIVFIGDPYQLPAIGTGQPVHEIKKFCTALGVAIEFTKCKRHKDDADGRLIFDNCTAILAGKPNDVIWNDTSFIHEHFTHQKVEFGCYQYGAKALEIVRNPLYGITHYNHIVLGYTKIVRDSINPVLWKHFTGQTITQETYKDNANALVKDTRIISLRNWYINGNTITANETQKIVEIQDCRLDEDKPQQRRYNKKKNGSDGEDSDIERPVKPKKKNSGDIARSLCDVEDGVEVKNSRDRQKFPNAKRRLKVESLDHFGTGIQKYIPYLGPYKRKISLAYSVTFFGVQGGQYPKVAIVHPYPIPWLTREGMYTAASRAEEMFIYAGCIAEFEKCVLRTLPPRNSTLGEMLKNTVMERIPNGWNPWKIPARVVEVKQLEECVGDFDEQEEFEVGAKTKFTTVYSTQDSGVSVQFMGRMLRYTKTENEVSPLWVFARVMLTQSFENIKMIFRLKRVSKKFRDLIEHDQMWIQIFSALLDSTDPIFLLKAQVVNINEYIAKDRKSGIRIIINSFGKSLFQCKQECCKPYVISALSMISEFSDLSQSNMDIIGSKSNPNIFSTIVKQRVCGCVKAECQYILIKKQKYEPVTSTMVNPKKYKVIDVSGLANEHPDVLDKSRRAATKMVVEKPFKGKRLQQLLYEQENKKAKNNTKSYSYGVPIQDDDDDLDFL